MRCKLIQEELLLDNISTNSCVTIDEEDEIHERLFNQNQFEFINWLYRKELKVSFYVREPKLATLIDLDENFVLFLIAYISNDKAEKYVMFRVKRY